MNFTHKIDGQDVSIRRLKVSELAVLHEAADAWNAESSGFVKGSLSNLWTYANSIGGASAILNKSGLNEAQIDSLERYDMATIALKACGFTLPDTEQPPEMDRDGAPVRPTTGNQDIGTG